MPRPVPDDPDYLWIDVDPYDEWNREVTVAAHASGFTGIGRMYMSLDLLRAFARAIAEYPLPASAVVLNGGYEDHETVRVEARPISRVGQVGLLLHLASDPDDAPSGDARFDVWTTYERLRRFAQDLNRVLNGPGGDARIEGERLG